MQQVRHVLRLVVLVACAVQLSSAKLADYVSACSVKDPKLNECIVKQAAILLPSITKGIKEFGFPSMDPLRIPVMRIEEGRGGSVGLAFNITDSKHFGWVTNKLDRIKADVKKHHYELFLFTPKYSIIGNYEVKGRILVLPITGTGFCNMTIENINTTVILDGRLEERGGVKYLAIDTVKCSFDFDKIHIRLDNLFGNKQLSDAMNVFLNENGRDAFNELKPAIVDVFAEIYMSFLGRMFSKIPYDQLFRLD